MSALSILWTLGVVCLILVVIAAGPQAALPCFIALFVVGIIGSIIYNVANISSEKGVNTESFDFKVEGFQRDSGDADVGEPDFAVRLRDLEELRKEGLISEDEYKAKRQQIMSDQW